MARKPKARPDQESTDVSVLIPAQDEAGNLAGLVPEIIDALDGENLEIIVIDDASKDQTANVVRSLRNTHPQVRLIMNQSAAGKSGALWIGAAAAKGRYGITVDGDGQNDPQFLMPMLELLRGDDRVGVVAGQRQRRGDGRFKLIASRIANGARSRLLRDNTWDTACGLKAFRMDAFRALPHFETLHRFLPALMAADGWHVKHVDVVDRPREFGESKYGILDRLAVGIPDLFGVWWLTRRRRRLAGINSRAEE